VKQETLRLLFSYNRGKLYWRPRPLEAFKKYSAFVMWNKRYANNPAGSPNKRGYIRIGIAKKYYMAHRLIWLYHRGWLPEALDHKNGRPWDNRMSNLRVATQTENRWNSRRRISTTTNTKGVYKRPSGNYEAHICADYKRVHLGTFERKKDAIQAVAKARKNLHREFARHR
jgi:hypothetical protein